MIIHGREVADDIYGALLKRAVLLHRAPRLGILVGKTDPVIESFVRIKARAAEQMRVELIKRVLPDGVGTEEALRMAQGLVSETDGVIVQLPLPSSIDTDAVLAVIPLEKDVDGINPSVRDDDRPVRAPVARAIEEILERAGVVVAGKRAVVVGEGRLVGKPVAALLRARGAIVSVFSLETGSIEDLKEADIVVSGAGTPGLIRPEHLKEGVILIDAGASEQSGVIAGDADPACEEKASVFTPVPGGVGPIAVAMIFANLFDLVRP